LTHLWKETRLWRVGATLALGLHIVGDVVLHDGVEPALSLQPPHVVSVLLSVSLGLALTWWVLRQFEPVVSKRSGRRHPPNLAPVAVFFAGVSVIGLATALFGLIEILEGKNHPLGWVASALYALVFIVSSTTAARLYRKRTPILNVRGTVAEKTFKPRKALVCFLSLIGPRPDEAQVPAGETLNAEIDSLRAAKMREPNNRNLQWPAEPLLAAIAANLPCIERLIVVPSCDPKGAPGRGTINQMQTLLTTLKRFDELNKVTVMVLVKDYHEGIPFTLLRADPQDYQPGRPVTLRAIDFEDVEDLTAGMEEVLRVVREEWGWADSELSIDITGGQKVTTVAAAVASFNRDIRAQYMQTLDPWKMLSYDIELAENPPVG